MFCAGLDVYCHRSRRGIAPRRHLDDSQNMGSWWQQGAEAATLYHVRHRLAVDLKIKTDIPSEIRHSIDGEAARRVEVIRPEVTTCVRKCADEDRARKNQHQKPVSREAMFCFHGRYCSH